MSSLPANATEQDRQRLGRFNSVFYGSGSMGDLAAANRHANTVQPAPQDGGVDFRKIDGQIADPRYRQGPQSNAGGGAYAAYRPGNAQSQQSPYAQSKQHANQSSAYNYGQAQPKQDSYATSSPYQKNPAGDFAAYSPQGTSPFGQAPKMPTGATDGNWANFDSPQRPPAFQASYGSPFGGQSQQPNFAQRDAFIQSLNNQATPYMAGQQRGPIRFDMNAAMGSANQMMEAGFQNPFNFGQTLAQQSFPSQYQPAPPPQPQASAPQVQGRPDSLGSRSGLVFQQQAANPSMLTMAPSSAPGAAQSQQDPYATSTPYAGPRPTISPGMQSSGQQSWSPVPGYGFDREGNQVPVSEGGIFNTPNGSSSYTGQSPYEREIELMKAQGRYGRQLSPNEQAINDAVVNSKSWQSERDRAQAAMQNRRPTARQTGAEISRYGVAQDNSMVGGVANRGSATGNWRPGVERPRGENLALDAMQDRTRNAYMQSAAADRAKREQEIADKQARGLGGSDELKRLRDRNEIMNKQDERLRMEAALPPGLGRRGMQPWNPYRTSRASQI